MLANLFTDGSGTTRGNPGGWAFLLVTDLERMECSGGCLDTTNNRMELTAAISGLIQAEREGCLDVCVHSDSEYVVQGINSRLAVWHKRDYRRSSNGPLIANDDLWRDLAYAISNLRSVKAKWIRGHNKHPENERCDKLAGAERARLLLPNTKPTETRTRRLPSLI
jgi:ribonuclease HI